MVETFCLGRFEKQRSGSQAPVLTLDPSKLTGLFHVAPGQLGPLARATPAGELGAARVASIPICAALQNKANAQRESAVGRGAPSQTPPGARAPAAPPNYLYGNPRSDFIRKVHGRPKPQRTVVRQSHRATFQTRFKSQNILRQNALTYFQTSGYSHLE